VGSPNSEQGLIPALFVHGLIGSLDDQDVLRHLAPRPVLTPDLLGYGRHADVPPQDVSLDAQVNHLGEVLEASDTDRVHLIGHSVGGVVAALVAYRHPERVASFISVEGNFTLADAFWSAKIAGMTALDFEEMFADTRADPGAWLRDAGVEPDERRLRLARRWLERQPASTVQAMAGAVVETTGRPSYERALRSVFDRTVVHLVAGERSRQDWDVPRWALAAARDLTLIPDAGHLMMAERPKRFADTIAVLLRYGCP
jgi:lipase